MHPCRAQHRDNPHQLGCEYEYDEQSEPSIAPKCSIGLFLALSQLLALRHKSHRACSLLAQCHQILHDIDQLLLVDQLLKILRHERFLLLLKLC